ncbi:hypothetical protein ACQP2T_30280 [Nonomuraea sp. CA-143628]|uniref:hypothetical protein n=1 Tax=Nonomuraea sp. CA-143628 TaxID=3239997 RepID=UPI003D8AD4E2
MTPQGEQAMVNITSSFAGETGVAGFVVRIIAPRRLHRVYVKPLGRHKEPVGRGGSRAAAGLSAQVAPDITGHPCRG